MTVRHFITAGVVWALSLVGVGVWAQNSGASVAEVVDVQAEAPVIQGRSGQGSTISGQIITGEDLGFQLVTDRFARPGKIAGKLMVRIGGQWHEASGAVALHPASQR